MKKNLSAGILLYRMNERGVEVLLVHPGGPFFNSKDQGAWSIPKGVIEDGESACSTALRELQEETGIEVRGELVPLGEIRQKGGKRVLAWACATGVGGQPALQSNTFELEWPPRSGKMAEFREVDQARFFTLAEAREKMNGEQAVFLERLEEMLDGEIRARR